MSFIRIRLKVWAEVKLPKSSDDKFRQVIILVDKKVLQTIADLRYDIIKRLQLDNKKVNLEKLNFSIDDYYLFPSESIEVLRDDDVIHVKLQNLSTALTTTAITRVSISNTSSSLPSNITTIPTSKQQLQQYSQSTPVVIDNQVSKVAEDGVSQLLTTSSSASASSKKKKRRQNNKSKRKKKQEELSMILLTQSDALSSSSSSATSASSSSSLNQPTRGNNNSNNTNKIYSNQPAEKTISSSLSSPTFESVSLANPPTLTIPSTNIPITMNTLTSSSVPIPQETSNWRPPLPSVPLPAATSNTKPTVFTPSTIISSSSSFSKHSSTAQLPPPSLSKDTKVTDTTPQLPSNTVAINTITSFPTVCFNSTPHIRFSVDGEDDGVVNNSSNRNSDSQSSSSSSTYSVKSFLKVNAVGNKRTRSTNYHKDVSNGSSSGNCNGNFHHKSSNIDDVTGNSNNSSSINKSTNIYNSSNIGDEIIRKLPLIEKACQLQMQDVIAYKELSLCSRTHQPVLSPAYTYCKITELNLQGNSSSFNGIQMSCRVSSSINNDSGIGIKHGAENSNSIIDSIGDNNSNKKMKLRSGTRSSANTNNIDSRKPSVAFITSDSLSLLPSPFLHFSLMSPSVSLSAQWSDCAEIRLVSRGLTNNIINVSELREKTRSKATDDQTIIEADQVDKMHNKLSDCNNIGVNDDIVGSSVSNVTNSAHETAKTSNISKSRKNRKSIKHANSVAAVLQRHSIDGKNKSNIISTGYDDIKNSNNSSSVTAHVLSDANGNTDCFSLSSFLSDDIQSLLQSKRDSVS